MALAATIFPRFQFRSPGPTLIPKSPSPYVKAVMDLRDAPKFRAVAAAASGSVTAGESDRKLPVLLFDIMSTVVRDPFYNDMPSFFGMTLKELMECKHPTAWNEFEKGLIDEVELARIFFKDGRSFDLEGWTKALVVYSARHFRVMSVSHSILSFLFMGYSGERLKSCMRAGYEYLQGIEKLLQDLKQNGYEMHAFTNYPIWYEIIEDKLNISNYLFWTFCSCVYGKRKPDLEFYRDALSYLKVDAASCIFIDDSLKNVVAAAEVGIVGLLFKGADSLRQDLLKLGIEL